MESKITNISVELTDGNITDKTTISGDIERIVIRTALKSNGSEKDIFTIKKSTDMEGEQK